MGQIKNTKPFPQSLICFVQAKLRETVRRQDEPRSGISRFFGIPYVPLLRSGKRIADVRWFSECNAASMDCSGYLLGRWIVHSEGAKPLEYDFAAEPGSPADTESEMGIEDPLHCMVYNFAICSEGDRGVLVESDLDGRVRRAMYELPQGIHSATLGRQIGQTVEEHFKRDPWDECVPPGWKPRPHDGGEADPNE